MKRIFTPLMLTLLALFGGTNVSAQTTVTYAIQEGETHTAGETVEVKDSNDEAVATLTFGFADGADFKAGKKSSVGNFVAFTEGNGENGTEDSGTNYIIAPKYDGEIEVGVVLNAKKAFFVLEDGTALEDYNGIKVEEKYTGTYKFNVTGGKTYKVFCTGSKLGFHGFNYTFTPAGPDTPPTADEATPLTADMFYTWDGPGADANQLSPATFDFNIGNDQDIDAGGMVCGDSNVDYKTYADITGSSKLLIEGTPGMVLRVLMNRLTDGGQLVEKNPTIGEDGTTEVDLTDLEYVHINAIKNQWGWSGGIAGKVNSIKFVKPSDALAIPKEALKKAISTAKLYNAVAKTEDSYAALQTAIANGETALAAEDATAESLAAAKSAIEEAIAGLTLAEGYSDLTKEMFMEYASVEEPGEGKAANGAYSLFEASGLPYGDGNVSELLWADLTAYDKLIITTVGEIKPRLCMNRLVANGQQAATKEDSKMLDINPNNEFTWSTEAYQTIDGNVYTIDLKKIVEDYTFARLHCIKKQGWGPDVFVTGMYLYKATEEQHTHTWNFQNWSEATVANLKAEAAKVAVEEDENNPGHTTCTDNDALWSDHEKVPGKDCDTYGASKDNCFWSIATPNENGELTANGEVIAELKGLEFNSTYASSRALAIAVNYPSTSLGTYHGPSYLWFGGSGKEILTIKNVKVGTTIKMGVESHKNTDARGVELYVAGEKLEGPAAPKTYEEQEWTVAGENIVSDVVDVVIKNTNGCHIYFIDAEQDLTQVVPTGINTVKTEAENGNIYNLQGQKVLKAQKGLYIINGKKIVIK